MGSCASREQLVEYINHHLLAATSAGTGRGTAMLPVAVAVGAYCAVCCCGSTSCGPHPHGVGSLDIEANAPRKATLESAVPRLS